MGTVYIVQEPRLGPDHAARDFSPAMQYGQLRFVLRASDNPSLQPNRYAEEMWDILQNFGKDDFLLWAGGDPLGLAIAASLVAQANEGFINWLRWDRERDSNTGRRTGMGYYTPVKVFVYEEDNGKDEEDTED